MMKKALSSQEFSVHIFYSLRNVPITITVFLSTQPTSMCVRVTAPHQKEAAFSDGTHHKSSRPKAWGLMCRLWMAYTEMHYICFLQAT